MVTCSERPRLAYLASQYSAPSHTFIRREVSALRAEGWLIDTFSIRPGPAECDESLSSEKAPQTFVVVGQPLWAFAVAHLTWLLRNPLGYLRSLALAARHRPPGLRSMLLALAHFVEAGLLARELDLRNIEHLHNHFANSGATVGMIAAKLAGIRWSFTMHGISETDYPAGMLLGRKIQAADCVMCASWFMRAQGLRTVMPDQWHKLHVVRCGVDVEEVKLRQEAGRNFNSLICVGRLSPEKGHAGLFEAFAQLSASWRGLELRLIGDGPDRPMLEDLARRLEIAERVQFLGARSETSTLSEIATSDLLVLPSFLEGLPVVLIEAMAIGVPVVAPRVAGIPELVEHGNTGLLFTASNWDELADRIKQLGSDAELRSRIVQAGRQEVATSFDVRTSAARLSELFGSVHAALPITSKREGHHLSFGLREAIAFSVLAFGIAVAVALSTHLSSPGPQPLARGTSSGKGQIERNLPGDVKGNPREHR